MKTLHPVATLLLSATLCMLSVPGADGAQVRSRGPATPAPTDSDAVRRSDATPAVADNRLIVRLKGKTSAAKLSAIYTSADTSAGAVGKIRGGNLTWRVPANTTRDKFADRLEASGKIAYAEPNYLRQPASYVPPAYATPNDPAYLNTEAWGYSNGAGGWTELYPYAKSWWFRQTNAASAWQAGYTGPDVTGKYPLRADGDSSMIGVIDTGFYVEHPDAGANIIAGTADVAPVDPSAVPDDVTSSMQEKTAYVSHGTCVAGLGGATTHNGVGTLGIANDTKVAVYKVYFGGDGIADSDIITAINMAVDDGCKVINLSLAGSQDSQALREAINDAWNAGCVIVAASGNDGESTVSYPAAMDHVVAVGALGLQGDGITPYREDFSNYGLKLDMSAPGTWIWGLTKPDFTDPAYGELGYRWWDGTSMASPIVASGVAWLWRAAPDLSNAEIVSLAQNTAEDLGASGRDNRYGYGAFDMQAAYAELIADYPLLEAPTVSVVSQTNANDTRVAWTPVSGYEVTYKVEVDGTEFSSTSSTGAAIPYGTSAGPHTVTVKPTSPRNWTDGTESSSVEIIFPPSTPAITALRHHHQNLLWTDTETGLAHTDLLSIDGEAAQAVTHGIWSTASLDLGSHTASLSVQNGDGTPSEPATLTFTVRTAPSVVRKTGTNRYSYATALSKSVLTTASTAVLVGSKSWMNAMAAAPLARTVGGPVLVSSRTKLPKTTRNELARLNVDRVIIVGGTGDVSSSVRRYLLGKHYSVTRISGADSYATANAVARSIAARNGGTVPDGKVVVVGKNYVNALSASAVAARRGWPLLHTSRATLRTSTRRTLRAIGAASTLVVGGTGTVSSKVRSKLPSPTRISATPSTAVPTRLAQWATERYPESFSGERIYLASSSLWYYGLGLPAAAATQGSLVLVTGSTLASPVRSYYTLNSDIAVTTRVTANSKAIGDPALATVRDIVGAP